MADFRQVQFGINIHVIDNFTGATNKIKAGLNTLKNQTAAFQSSLQGAKSLYGSLALGGGLASMRMGQWFKEGAQFGFVMEGVGASTKASAEEMSKLKGITETIGFQTGFSPNDMAEGLRQGALAGLEVKDMLKALGPAAYLARAGMAPLVGEGGTMEILANTMRHFDTPFDQAGIVADKLTKASIKSSLSVKELAESMKYSASTAMDLGVGMDQTIAVMMTVANAGIKGSMAGVGFENMLRYLAKALGEFSTTKKAGRAMTALGMLPQDMVDGRGNLKSIGDLIGTLVEKMQGMGDIPKQNLLYDIFQVRGKRQASLLMRNLEEYKKNLAIIQNSQGEAALASGRIMDTSQGALLRLSNAWDQFKISFSEAIAPIVVPFLKAITWLIEGIRNFMGTGFGAWVGRLVAGVILLKTITWGFKFVLSSILLVQTQISTQWSAASTAMSTGWTALITQAKVYASIITGIGMTPATGMGMAGISTVIGKNGRKYNVYNKGNFAGKSGFASKAAVAAARAGTLGRGAALAGMGGSLMGFLSGPVGIASMLALTIGLPLIISAFDKNTDETKANTDAIKEGTKDSEAKNLINRLIMSRMMNAPGTSPRSLYTYNHRGGGNEDWQLEQNFRDYMMGNNLKGSNRQFFDFREKGMVSVYVNGIFGTKGEVENGGKQKRFDFTY